MFILLVFVWGKLIHVRITEVNLACSRQFAPTFSDLFIKHKKQGGYSL